MKKTLCMLLVAVAVLFAGCQKATEAAVNAALAKDGVQVNTNGESGTITSKDGTLTFNTGGDAKLPADFPADVPLYAGAKLVSTMTLPTGMTVAQETGDALAKVAAFYKSAMTGKGWKQEVEVNGEGSAMLTYSQDKKTLQVTIGGESGKTTIVLMYIPPEK